MSLLTLFLSTVDCTWSPHGPWSPCSKPCGVGTQTRSRTVLQESRGPGAIECKGAKFDTRICNRQQCGAGTGPTALYSAGWLNRIRMGNWIKCRCNVVVLQHVLIDNRCMVSYHVRYPWYLLLPKSAAFPNLLLLSHPIPHTRVPGQGCSEGKTRSPCIATVTSTYTYTTSF